MEDNKQSDVGAEGSGQFDTKPSRTMEKNKDHEIASIGRFVCLRDFFSRNGKCINRVSLKEKTVIITGGNAGIGKETALDLAGRGAKVIIASRDVKKGNNVTQDIREKFPDARVSAMHLDLASLSSVRRFAEDILRTEQKIHILINNAGIAMCPKGLTEDGYETHFGVNHLGHFLLTHLLLDRMKASVPARIITVSSVTHRWGQINFDDINLDNGYNSLLAYGRSKLANVLFTKELAARLEGTGVTTYCLHPGLVHTEITRSMRVKTLSGMFTKLFFKSANAGAQTTIYCAVDEAIASESGCYYSDCCRVQPSTAAMNDDLAKKLWNLSEKLTGLV